MNKTQIEWVQNPDGSQGYTWNPITGCLNHDNGLCKGGGFPCYAYKLANGRVKQRYLANNNIAPYTFEYFKPTAHGGKDSPYLAPFYPRFWEERLYHPFSGKPRGIFPCDMSDLFGIGVPEEWTRMVLDLCRRHEQNRYYLLTKQAQRLPEFSPFPDNCWVGVTATNWEMAHQAMYHLGFVDAKVKFISAEPLLAPFTDPDPIDSLKSITAHEVVWDIDWLIIGTQTNPYKPPKIEWVREIVEAADKAGIPVFLKDNIRPLLIPEDSRPNYLMDDIFWASEKAQLRQEMPE